MTEKYKKYAELLLKKGVCLEKNQPLVLVAPIEAIKFVRVLTEVAAQMGAGEIYYDWEDDYLKHTSLLYFDKNKIENSLFWNKTIHDIYANKNAAFLYLISANDNIMSDISNEKMNISRKKSIETREIYRNLQEDNKISWCIASVATKDWAKLIYPKEKNALEKLWNTIFDICLINDDDSIKNWNNKLARSEELSKKISNMNIKSLHYKNSLGTDLTIELAENNIWCDGSSIINGKKLLVNIPTEEVFTTPNKYKTNGIVYCSKPLVHNGIRIDNIKLVFKDGKVIEYDSTTGKEELGNIINYDEDSSRLGEAALVDYNSKISNSNILFYETLFDENAACHIALGAGFKECIDNGSNLTEEELDKIGYNISKEHVDIMMGTKDLNITATTYDNKTIELFKNGSFNI